MLAFTFGGVRDFVQWRGFRGRVRRGRDLLRRTAALQPVYSTHPVSFHVSSGSGLRPVPWAGCGTCGCRSRWPATR